MGRPTNFTEQQRAAVTTAAIEYRMSARAIETAANAGELGLEPFSISPSTISTFTREERQRRRDEGELETMPVQARLDDLHHRLVELAEHAADELEEAETFDIGRLRQLIGVVKNLNSPSLNSPSSARTSAGDRAANLLERLAARNTGNGDGFDDEDDDEDPDDD